MVAINTFSIRTAYLMLCAKDKDGKLCPVSDYLSKRPTQFAEASLVETTDEIKKMIANDCKDENCNKRMVSAINIMQTLTMGSSKRDSGNIFFTVFSSFGDNYSQKTCSAIDGSKDDANSKTNESNSTTDNSASQTKEGDKKEETSSSILNQKMTYSTMILLFIVSLMLL